MQKVEFRERLEGIEADLLIVAEDRVPAVLEELVRYNLERGVRSITTNGAYPVAQLEVVGERVDYSTLPRGKRVVIACECDPVELILSGYMADRLIFIGEEGDFQRRRGLVDGVVSAKRLTEAPSNRMTPQIFARECEWLRELGVRVEVCGEKKLREIGAEALLAVGRGSVNPPRMVVLEWAGADEDPTVLVGKGVCYDAGGINLKSANLVEMRRDKAGAAAVFGVLEAAARMKLPRRIVGILLLAENMPDGNAFRPGDVIETLGGKSVEVIDTDCEGRLLLADGLAYAQRLFKPKAIIDLGTLTLETFGALGGAYAGVFSTDEELVRALSEAGEASGERVWRLPLGSYYADQLKSEVADLRNVGVFRYGGSSAAAEFLRAFVADEMPWAHIDISGVAWDIAAPERGVSGFGVRLLIEFLKR